MEAGDKLNPQRSYSSGELLQGDRPILAKK